MQVNEASNIVVYKFLFEINSQNVFYLQLLGLFKFN